MPVKYKYILLLATVAVSMLACQKWSDYKKHEEGGEINYPGKGDTIIIASGNKRLRIDWTLSSDPNAKSYKLYWNDGNDSTLGVLPAGAAGTVFSIPVEGLEERIYNFELYTVDGKNNLSVPNVFSGKVFGEKYQQTLLNRAIVDKTYINDSLRLLWGAPDTVNITTEVIYTDTTGQTLTLSLPPYSTELLVDKWKLGTKLAYRSVYKPNKTAIDSFAVVKYDSFTVQNILVNKSKWTIAKLPNDAQTDSYGTNLSFIWNGSPGNYPNIYHTGGSDVMPQHFTFDLGGEYFLTAFEEAGRQDCACHNPDQFELWGIADTTGAATMLPSNDAGWKDESIAKGWTLMANIVRTDNGIAPYKINLPADLPALRFIRIRVLHTVDNHQHESHMSEVNFWYNP